MERVKESKFKRICVFCGSSQGKKISYQEAAIELGKELVCFFSTFFFRGYALWLPQNISFLRFNGFFLYFMELLLVIGSGFCYIASMIMNISHSCIPNKHWLCIDNGPMHMISCSGNIFILVIVILS